MRFNLRFIRNKRNQKFLSLFLFLSLIVFSFQNCARHEFTSDGNELLNTQAVDLPSELPLIPDETITTTLPSTTTMTMATTTTTLKSLVTTTTLKATTTTVLNTPATMVTTTTVRLTSTTTTVRNSTTSTTQAVVVPTCNSKKGNSCTYYKREKEKIYGCQDTRALCADFSAFYYGSPDGCSYDLDKTYSGSETKFENGERYLRAFNKNPNSNYVRPWELIPQTNGAGQRVMSGNCTTTHDVFNIPANGQCIQLASNYDYPEGHSYARIVPAADPKSCWYLGNMIDVPKQGTIQCDGSCQ